MGSYELAIWLQLQKSAIILLKVKTNVGDAEEVELYDFERDPRGGVNRAAESEYKETAARLTSQLKSLW